MKALLALLVAASLVAAGRPAPAAVPASDPRAVRVATDVMSALGGSARWNALGGLRWTFAVSSHDTTKASRQHWWDRRTGRHRVEGTMHGTEHFVIVHTLGDSTHGAAWVNGHAIAGDSLHTLIKRAYAMWVNDCYWFLMPYKLLDPGVHLAYDGQIRDSLGTFDRIELTFGNVGLTPGDHYWVDVNRASHRVQRWQYVLQGQSPPPSHWSWEGWEQHDALWFPTVHRQGATAVWTRDVQTVREFPAATFRTP